jgi:hypothetical protein
MSSLSKRQKDIFFVPFIIIACGSRPMPVGHRVTQKMCPIDFMLVTHGQILSVVIFSLVID